MKKLVLAFTMVVLLAAAVFGGQAIASSKSTDISVSEQTSEEILSGWGSSYWGYPVRMKTLSDSVTIEQEIGGIIESYPGVRHVSLTLHISGLDDTNDIATLQVYFGDNFAPDLDSYSNEVIYRTYEFDAERWTIQVQDDGGEPIEIKYHATITYPSNQW